jgi:Asp-tRNA(Asn)/Glu-tRNA(Gln) amidotransferase A subunit family amidase
MNGVYGFKPSVRHIQETSTALFLHSGVISFSKQHTRLPFYGLVGTECGQETVHPVAGPLATSLPTLKLLTKVVIDAEPWRLDPKCSPIPWRDEAQLEWAGGKGSKAKMCVGLMRDDGIVRAHPYIERALDMVVEALKADGHEGMLIAGLALLEACVLTFVFIRSDRMEAH